MILKVYIFMVWIFYTACADAVCEASFLRTKICYRGFQNFWLAVIFFSGLKTNKEKCEVAVISVKKGVRWHSVEWKILIFKKHSENSRSSLFLKRKTRKEFQKSYTENRDYFENLEHGKFKP